MDSVPHSVPKLGPDYDALVLSLYQLLTSMPNGLVPSPHHFLSHVHVPVLKSVTGILSLVLLTGPIALYLSLGFSKAESSNFLSPQFPARVTYLHMRLLPAGLR